MKKKKIETSKKILIVSYFAAITLTVIVVYGTFKGVDMSNVTPIALAAWGEVAVTNAFYYKKAGKENVPKILRSFPPQIREQIDINQLLNHD